MLAKGEGWEGPTVEGAQLSTVVANDICEALS